MSEVQNYTECTCVRTLGFIGDSCMFVCEECSTWPDGHSYTKLLMLHLDGGFIGALSLGTRKPLMLNSNAFAVSPTKEYSLVNLFLDFQRLILILSYSK